MSVQRGPHKSHVFDRFILHDLKRAKPYNAPIFQLYGHVSDYIIRTSQMLYSNCIISNMANMWATLLHMRFGWSAKFESIWDVLHIPTYCIYIFLQLVCLFLPYFSFLNVNF